MKLRILGVNCLSGNRTIPSKNFVDAPSFSDFDAVVLDPIETASIWTEGMQPDQAGCYRYYEGADRGMGKAVIDLFGRRQAEATALLKTGGVLVCFLRPHSVELEIRFHSSFVHTIDNYSWLPQLELGSTSHRSRPSFPSYLKITPRDGDSITQVGFHPFATYLNAFKDELLYSAIAPHSRYDGFATTFAVSRVGEPVCVDFRIDEGHLVFIPAPRAADPDKLTGVLSSCIRDLIQRPTQIQVPAWAAQLEVPTERAHKATLEGIQIEMDSFEKKHAEAQRAYDETVKLKGLMYETGRLGLEPLVRSAFLALGFKVRPPEDYAEKYDIWVEDENPEIIAEVEGAEGQVDIAKYRQLLDYVDERSRTSEKAVKGILIANGYRNQEPEKRGEQFTAAAIKGCRNQRFCRMTTSELFKAVCFALEHPEDAEALAEIRKSIAECEESWVFPEKFSRTAGAKERLPAAA